MGLTKLLQDMWKGAIESHNWDRVIWVSAALIIVVGITQRKKISGFFKDLTDTNKFKNKFYQADQNLRTVAIGVEKHLSKIEASRVNFSKVADQARAKIRTNPSSSRVNVEPEISQLQEIYDLSLQDLKQTAEVVKENIREADRLAAEGSAIVKRSAKKHYQKKNR